MELIFILFFLIVILIVTYYIFNIQIKQMKCIKYNKKLDKIIAKFPENKQICIDVLKILNNSKVKIKEENYDENNKKSNTSLYVALTDTIFIGKISDTYTRIQTICHECLHSIQPRRLLVFNFIYSNIYIIYFSISLILSTLGVFDDMKLQIIIISIMSFLYFIIRSYLETDAMIKAKYLAKEYMLQYIRNNKICSVKQVEEIIDEYERINLIGIPAYNYILFFKSIIKVIMIVSVAILKKIL